MGVHSDPSGSSKMSNNMKNLRGQLGLRSSALAPTSSKLTTQYMVMDHMKNHYSKISNARPAIDNRAPKSISTSQKVRDRNTREGKRPVSAMSVNYPVRPYSAMTGYEDDEIYNEDHWGDVDPDDEVEKQVREIMRKRLQTKTMNQVRSTNATQGSSSQSPYYSARLDQTAHPRPVSARSSARSVQSARYGLERTAMPTKTITQKTYDGDVIDKHNYVFTQPEKPFTPRVLKSNRVSRIAQSKYYTSPPQKRDPETTDTKTVESTSPTPKPRAKPRRNAPLDKSGEMTDTLMFESLQSRDFSRYSDEKEQVVPRLDISLDKDNMNWIKEQAMKAEIRAKSGNLRSGMSRINEDQMLDSDDFQQTGNMTLTGGSLNKTTRSFGTKSLHSSQRLSTDFNNVKKPVKGKREEELQYVEFIKEVTDDVLNRGVFTDRVLKQVFESHIAKKKGKLNEEKMRSMLSQVRQDLDIKDESESPDYSPLNTTSSLGSRLHTKYSRGRTGEQTFGSTMDSQNTYNFKDTSSGDMFSTIHSENDELTATQALKSYQLDITRHVENEEGNESPGEIVQSEDELGKTNHVLDAENKSVKSSKSGKSSKSAHSSAHFPDERSIKSGKSLGHRSVQSSNHTSDNRSVQSGKSQSSQKSEGFKPQARPRALTQNEDISESSENQSTVRGDDDYDDEYAEYEETETEDGTKATHRTSDEDF